MPPVEVATEAESSLGCGRGQLRFVAGRPGGEVSGGWERTTKPRAWAASSRDASVTWRPTCHPPCAGGPRERFGRRLF